MQGTWENGEFILASTKDDKIARLQKAVSGAVAGIDGVDALLVSAGYQKDSSARHQLSIIRSSLTANAALTGEHTE